MRSGTRHAGALLPQPHAIQLPSCTQDVSQQIASMLFYAMRLWRSAKGKSTLIQAGSGTPLSRTHAPINFLADVIRPLLVQNTLVVFSSVPAETKPHLGVIGSERISAYSNNLLGPWNGEGLYAFLACCRFRGHLFSQKSSISIQR